MKRSELVLLRKLLRAKSKLDEQDIEGFVSALEILSKEEQGKMFVLIERVPNLGVFLVENYIQKVSAFKYKNMELFEYLISEEKNFLAKV